MKQEPKTKRLNFRLDASTDAIIREKANAAGMRLTDYVIASAVCSRVISYEDIRPLVGELKRIGNNLNQLVILAREGRIRTVDLAKVQQELSEMHQLLARILRRRM